MQKFLFSEYSQPHKIVNVASVPQRSPFRYPGGKTWFVPRLREWLLSQPEKPTQLVEPFAGGGIVSLTSVFENLVESAFLVELDGDVAAVWEAILNGNAEWLASRILNFEMDKDNVVAALSANKRSAREVAFQTILKNRTFHGGILAAGSGFIKKGEADKGITSRWYPATLAKRIKSIDSIKERLFFEHGDALEILRSKSDESTFVYFIDPPYTAGGKKAGSRLYAHSELDHDRLFSICSKLKGDFIMTYDNADEVKRLATAYGFQAKPIAMKNTHHAEMTELVIGRDLAWMDGVDRVLEAQSKYNSDRCRKMKKPVFKSL